MSREWRFFLDDMILCCEKITKFVGTFTLEEFLEDALVYDAVFRNLEILGEAAKHIPAEVKAGQSVPGSGWHSSTPEEAARRSVYIHVKRSLMMPILESFDVAETDRSSPVRFTTTQPTQALAMVNSKFLNDQAKLLADRLKRDAGPDPSAQVKLALSLATGRTPTAAEVNRGVALIEQLKGKDGVNPDEALKDFSLVVLNLNEFLYLD